MKAILLHRFIRYAQHFSVESIFIQVSKISMDVFKTEIDSLGCFACYKNYTVTVNGHRINDSVLVVQTWLIDLLYNVVNIRFSGNKNITKDETLYLIHLHNDYQNTCNSSRVNSKNVFYNVYGFFGEQKRFEEFDFVNEYSREEYILEKISKRNHPKNNSNIDFYKEFLENTGFSPKLFSSILLLIYGYFTNEYPIINIETLKCDFKNPNLNKDNVLSVINRYSCSIDEIKNAKLKRQFLYIKPFVRIGSYYVCSNSCLAISLFTNSNYWIMRNKYLNLATNKQKFLNAFGIYFEIYVEEVLSNCLSEKQFYNIPEGNSKRADWHLNIGEYNFIIEQKSSLSILGIKQTEPDIEKMKEYIVSTWGEAFEQLCTTEQELSINESIKVILLYEDYFMSESLELLFELRPDLKEKYDNRYWLVTIKELEMLLYTYKTNPDIFFEIIKAKDEAEKMNSRDGRTITKFLRQYKITKNMYLEQFGITNEFDELKNLIAN